LNLAPGVGLAAACAATDVPRATIYRQRRKAASPAETGAFAEASEPRRRGSHRRLSEDERMTVLELMHSDRFVDSAPAGIHAALLDEQVYHCSVRTMYRLLASCQETKERRNQRVHPAYEKPELLATKPNECWSWDITRLRGPTKWSYYYLYVIMDIFSRYVVGWMVAERECASYARRLIHDTCEREGIEVGQLTLHADRGSPMTAKVTAQLLADLGVTRTHSRPHCSNDNPYSEAQFKTMKYRPEFPNTFSTLQSARSFGQYFFGWYNQKHHHSGIAMLTPSQVHHGKALAVVAKRAIVLDAAWQKHPERFVHGRPTPKAPPTSVWINPPAPATVDCLPASPEATALQSKPPSKAVPEQPNVLETPPVEGPGEALPAREPHGLQVPRAGSPGLRASPPALPEFGNEVSRIR
jgi:putative transposase